MAMTATTTDESAEAVAGRAATLAFFVRMENERPGGRAGVLASIMACSYLPEEMKARKAAKKAAAKAAATTKTS